MIKKVGNWVFGSFFRTMGRFFFFLFFGFMLAMIISKNNISIKWTDLLGIEMVHASTSTYQSRTLSLSEVNYMELMGNDLRNNIEQFNVNSNYWIGLNRLSGTKIPVSQTNKKFTLRSDRFYNANFDYVYFNLYTMITVCSSGGDSALCSEISGARPTFSFNNLPCDIIDYSETIIGDSSSSNGGRSVYQNISYKCPNTSGGGYIQAYFDNFNYNYMYARIGINRTIWYSNLGLTDNAAIIEAIRGSNAGVIGSIEGQTQQQQEQHNETMNYIQDSNTTEANSEATNFFGNFTSQDNGGISSIITAPLTAISGLVSASCQQIVLPIPYLDNKELVLPCMSAIYTEHFGAFFTIYQTIIFGAIAYRIVVSLFMMIQGFKNPDDDKIEVVDL